MRILGIDPGKVNMALCFLDNNGNHETLKLHAIDHSNNAYRLFDLERQLNNYVNRYDSIDLIVHEGLAFAAEFGVAESGMVQYLIQRVAISNDVSFITIASTTMKRFLEIKTPKGGKSKGKTDLALAVYKKWNLEFPSQDETDAFILAKCGAAIMNGEFEPTKPRPVKKAKKCL